jgi:predicted RNA binding protein YcfA (HicA-like mRNA interferase family)
MKPLPFREVKRKLETAGFTEAGQTGSHLKFAKTTNAGTRTATVPKHHEVAPGTLYEASCGRPDSARRSSTHSRELGVSRRAALFEY